MVDGSDNSFYLEPGTILHAQYRINSVIGQGGFGITYDGTDLKLDMHVAIKEYFPNPMANRQTTVSLEVTCNAGTKGLYEKGMKNFLDEAKNMAKYAGEENFVSVHDYFAENNTAYIVMEFVEGQNLKQYMQHYGRLPIETAMVIIMPVMNALEKIHSRGMIHRDISPSNIMILPDGRVRLLDFGAAKDVSLETANMTTMSSVFKYGYSPIEQLTHGMKQGPYTDIYALCATIYEMLTGTTPPSPFQRAYEGQALIPPSALGVKISPVQEAALIKGLEVNGTDRIQTISELRDGLCGVRRNEDGLEYIPGSGKKPLLIAALGAIAAVLTVILAFAVYKNVSARKPGGKDSGPQNTAGTAITQQNDSYKEEESVSEENGDTESGSSDKGQLREEEAKQEETQSIGAETGAAIVYDEQSDEKDDNTEKVDIVYPTELPNGIYTFNGHSYGVYDANDYDLTTYSAVSNFCREQGGHLAVINNQTENDYLYNLMASLYDHTVFFGYSDENKEGNWQWDGDDSTYENWTQWGDWDLPDNGRDWGGNEDYAEFNYDTIHDWSPRDGTWNDAPFMDNTSIFICEWEYEFN